MRRVKKETPAICVFCQEDMGKLLIFKLLGSNKHGSVYKYMNNKNAFLHFVRRALPYYLELLQRE